MHTSVLVRRRKRAHSTIKARKAEIPVANAKEGTGVMSDLSID